MMRLVALCLLLAAVPALRAQQPPPGGGGGAQAERLRQEIRARWSAHVRQALNLTDDQATKLQATEDRFFQRRRELAQRQRAVLEALRGQLEPGVAGNPDSVRRLMETREQNRAALADLERDEDREIAGYLSPMQHARYQIMRQRFQERIADLRRLRRMRGRL